MRWQLSFLYFEATDNGDDTTTWEAMASVRPAQVAAVWAEVAQVLADVHRRFPQGPHELDEGGDWDMLLTVQHDSDAPAPVDWSPGTGQVVAPPPCTHCRWVCVVLTLACSPAVARVLQTWLAVQE